MSGRERKEFRQNASAKVSDAGDVMLEVRHGRSKLEALQSSYGHLVAGFTSVLSLPPQHALQHVTLLVFGAIVAVARGGGQAP